MALTEEEKNELVQDVVNQIKTDSQSVDELTDRMRTKDWKRLARLTVW